MILEARNLSYAYKSQKSKQILEHVSLIFEKRKFYTIVGESGAGKTTFLSLLAGLDTPTGGDILYNGENIPELQSDRLSHRKRKRDPGRAKEPGRIAGKSKHSKGGLEPQRPAIIRRPAAARSHSQGAGQRSQSPAGR